MFAPFRWFAIAVISAIGSFAGVRQVDLVIGGIEYYGERRCEFRLFELQLDGVWYETKPIDRSNCR